MHLLEKDVWVVWALNTVFVAPFGPHLTFKGGTSLSKAYGLIQRFSEDVDLTYDVRQLVSTEFEGADVVPLLSHTVRRGKVAPIQVVGFALRIRTNSLIPNRIFFERAADVASRTQCRTVKLR